MPKHRDSLREVSPLRDHSSFDTVHEYKQYLAQRRKQQETLRDRQRDRSKRSCPKREREQAERRVKRLPPKSRQSNCRQGSRRRRGAAVCSSGAAAGSTQAARVCIMFTVGQPQRACHVYGFLYQL